MTTQFSATTLLKFVTTGALVSLILGCGGGSDAGNNSTASSRSSSSVSSSSISSVSSQATNPIITSLKKSDATEIVNGSTLLAVSTCAGCDSTVTQYEWHVEGKTSPASTSDSFALNEEDLDKKISLTATPFNLSGAAGPTETVVYKRQKVVSIVGKSYGFVALKNDGTVTTLVDFNEVLYRDIVEQLTNVTAVTASYVAYGALKDDGTVVIWGQEYYGAYDPNKPPTSSLVNIKTIAGTRDAFAALNSDGQVVAWGNPETGGWGTSTSDIIRIVAGEEGFAATKADGTVVTWGGGMYSYGSLPLRNVVEVIESKSSKAAAFLQEDKKVIVVNDYPIDETLENKLNNITSVKSTAHSFTALKRDGSLVMWGEALAGSEMAAGLTDVIAICSSYGAFAALRSNGTVAIWGEENYGSNASDVEDQLTSVVAIVAAMDSFAALKQDGSVVTWGDREFGIDSTAASPYLTDVISISSNDQSFAAIRKDGSVVAWGRDPNGMPTLEIVSAKDKVIYSSLNE